MRRGRAEHRADHAQGDDNVRTTREPRVHAPRRPRREGGRAARHPRDLRAPRPLALEPRRAARSTSASRPQLDEVQRRILADVEARGFSVVSFGELFAGREHWRDARGDARPLRRRDRGRPREGRRARPRARGQGVRRAPPQLRRRARARRPVVPRRRVPPPARRREHLPRDVVEARVRRRLVLGAAAGRGAADLLAALAPRLQRQAPPEGRSSTSWTSTRTWGRSSTSREASRAGRTRDAWPWEPLGKNYPTEEELEARIPARRCRRSRRRRAR